MYVSRVFVLAFLLLITGCQLDGLFGLRSTASAPALTVVPQSGGYYHTIESGESLYTIARRYDVTAQAMVQANNTGTMTC